jgi:hypothetical protein
MFIYYGVIRFEHAIASAIGIEKKEEIKDEN